MKKYKFICNECHETTIKEEEPIKCFYCGADSFGFEEVQE